jgi:hypothetical protein
MSCTSSEYHLKLLQKSLLSEKEEEEEEAPFLEGSAAFIFSCCENFCLSLAATAAFRGL